MPRCQQPIASGWASATDWCGFRWAWKTLPTYRRNSKPRWLDGPWWPMIRNTGVPMHSISSRHDSSPFGVFRAFTRYRSLTLELTKREILGRYRGASFGLLWSLISPFLMLVVYTVAF